MNALDKDVRVQAFGNWFTFKAGQIKRMRGEIGSFLVINKAYYGFVELPMSFEDPEFKNSEEGQRILAEKRQQGIDARVRYLTQQIHNLRVSLRQDLDTANIKADVNGFATDGDLAAMDELLGYQRLRADAQKEKAEKARIALRRLEAAHNSAVNQDKKEG